MMFYALILAGVALASFAAGALVVELASARKLRVITRVMGR